MPTSAYGQGGQLPAGGDLLDARPDSRRRSALGRIARSDRTPPTLTAKLSAATRQRWRSTADALRRANAVSAGLFVAAGRPALRLGPPPSDRRRPCGSPAAGCRGTGRRRQRTEASRRPRAAALRLRDGNSPLAGPRPDRSILRLIDRRRLLLLLGLRCWGSSPFASPIFWLVAAAVAVAVHVGLRSAPPNGSLRERRGIGRKLRVVRPSTYGCGRRHRRPSRRVAGSSAGALRILRLGGAEMR